MEIIEIQGLTLQRNNRELFEGLNATITKGSISAIIGPNGCGKSSLLLAITGDLKPSSGSIFIAEKNLQDLSDLEQSHLRSMALQERTFWLPMTVREVLALGQSDEAKNQIENIADDLGLTELLGNLVTTLSVGQVQRIEIARTLLRDCPIYLFDEPFAAQDLASKEKLIEIFKQLRSAGKTIVLVAHSEVEKLSWCDQIIQLGS
ncbi:ABC transporter ATPase component [Candidatus Planktophila lacus]|uniref:ABC transporter ATP-binding protein n=1 Tax=Candidatus Planktophila lacus TaxID=1884913 RepID=UPI000BACC32D|nr:ATP-binding cassette domain-containing protein [Candidatus Planktophila lacus]ASY28857.1 ABC transporter ATPase component [Candidatus Planktophila lacus]